jgi:peptidyl-prolyl cis-trans isomerase A (cyclophilin A)
VLVDRTELVPQNEHAIGAVTLLSTVIKQQNGEFQMSNRIILGIAVSVLMLGVSTTAIAQSKVQISTSHGDITMVLNDKEAPITVRNFLQYVDTKFYDGLIFHRVIKGFMIQGGGFTPDMQKKATRAPIKLEVGKLSNKRGTIAMARTQVLDSATSQFFINHKDNAMLDSAGGGYAVFGKVTQGLGVVDKIANVKTTRKGGHANVPNAPVIIKSIRRVK